MIKKYIVDTKEVRKRVTSVFRTKKLPLSPSPLDNRKAHQTELDT